MLGRLGGLFGKSGREPAARGIPIADYDRALVAHLAGLGRRQQVAFATACAERLFPAYAAFREASGTSDGGVVRRALDLAWAGAITGVVPIDNPAALVQRCSQLIPGDGADFAIPPYADDAIAAAAYALDAAAMLSDGAPAWAVRRGTDTLDAFLLATVIDGDARNADELVWAHPLMQAEVGRREADLHTLAGADWTAAVAEVRVRAAATSVLPLDQLGDAGGATDP